MLKVAQSFWQFLDACERMDKNLLLYIFMKYLTNCRIMEIHLIDIFTIRISNNFLTKAAVFN